MNMKKLMAVVLAVVLAISAMAVTAFAGEAEVKRIDIFANHHDVTEYRVSTWEFNLPIYNLYGYANQDSYLELVLPQALLNGTYCEINWSIVVNGQSFGLKGTKGTCSYGAALPTETQYVNFGALTHSYFENPKGTDNWATIPQTVNFNEINTVKLVAEVKLPGWNQGYDPTWGTGDGTLKYGMYVQLWTAGTDGVKDYGNAAKDQKVTGSVTYAANMDITKTGGEDKSKPNAFKFISDPQNVVYTKSVPWGGYDTVTHYPVRSNDTLAVKTVVDADGTVHTVYQKDAGGNIIEGQTTDGYKVPLPEVDTAATGLKTDAFGNVLYAPLTIDTQIPLTWDHTLEQRSWVLAAESAKLVVELKDPMYGVAYYSLYMADSHTSPETTQGIGVPTDSLWWQDGTYNRLPPAFNREQKFVQTVFVNGNATQFEFDVPVSALVNGTYGIGSIAAAMNGEFRIYRQFETDQTGFQNQGWRYAYNNNGISYPTYAKAIYLLLTMPADDGDTVTAEDPIEPGDTDEEPDGVDVDEPKEEPKEEPKDDNPPTGIVLAVLPMVVAAAAVVASKRR